ncbi:ATP-binding protein [Symbioplanes lichenis]|uniref:ATP-binding protein n=1 Tax=Symbioplanes lichenis TaxID=1629072 RepID=UPI002739DA0D|nr:ATP-binding protein [Actinoplanes lichenis]
MLAPPGHPRELLAWDLASDHDLRLIRDGLLRHFGSSRDQAEIMGLVMTELAGNALRHGLPPIRVRLLQADDCYILDVSDRAPRDVPMAPEPQPDIRAGGRGLRIALSLAKEVCWHVDGDTKHVWAAFPQP